MTTTNKSAIEIGTNVLIKSLEINDVNVLSAAKAAVEEQRDLAEFFIDVIEIGVKAIQVTGTQIGIQQLASCIDTSEKNMVKSTAEAQQSLQQFIEAVTADNGIYDMKFKAIVDNFEKNIETLTTDENSPIREGIKGQMSEMAKDLKDELAREATRQTSAMATLVNPADPSSPMYSLAQAVESIKNDVTELRTEAAVGLAVAEVVDTSPMKGLPYEDQIITRMQQLSGLSADDCIPTGTTTGLIPKCKKGDAVINLKPTGDKIMARIVIEAKNSPISRASWDEEIEKGKKNRDAGGFIGFCKSVNDMPNKNRVLFVDRQTVILAHDPEVDDPQMAYLVYQFVKMSTLSSAGHLDDDKVSLLNDKLDVAMKNLTRFSGLSRDAKSIETTGKKMYTEINSLKDDLSADLASIGESLEVEVLPLVFTDSASLEIEPVQIDVD
jgi:CII-binding regulator of phage lambda lysogenization HflD